MDSSITSRVRAIARVVARRSHEDIDDLTQEGMMGAWMSIPRYNGMGTLAGWCSIRARGAMYDYLRRMDPLSRDHRAACKRGLERPPVILSLDYLEDALKRKI